MNASLLQPTLQGTLVHLSPMRAEDHDDLYAVAKDPLIWEQHPSWDRYKPEVFRPVFDQGLRQWRSAIPSLPVAAGVAPITPR